MERDEKAALVAMLRSASELEHELCCQYLYAAFSLKAGGDLGLTPSQASRAAQWNQQITKIAVQEMSHLMMASNLLTAIGGEPWLWRPNFPQPPRHYSEIGLPSMLAPLDLQTASRFMCWEKPDRSCPARQSRSSSVIAATSPRRSASRHGNSNIARSRRPITAA